jgi:hypothetical protein
MGLKPLLSLYFFNPFTEVNGNIRFSLSFVEFLLPSALADGSSKLQHFLASCPTGQADSPSPSISIKYLIQIIYFRKTV